jgi:hypothetical protein
MEREDELIGRAVVRMNAKLMGLVVGLVLGFGLFLATNILVLKGGPVVGPHLALLGQFYPGYAVTFLGSLIGFLYAFATGFVIGAVFGAVYNQIARI